MDGKKLFEINESVSADKKNRRLDNSLISEYQGDTLFSDVYIEHNALPNISFEDIDTSIEFMGKRIDFPLMINAMTGGTDQGFEVNEALFSLSQEFNIPMQLGAQDLMLEDESLADLYLDLEARESDKPFFLISNLSARASIEEIEKAMDILNTQGIGLHLNITQDLFSSDIKNNFSGILENISKVADKFKDRLIVKEVGAGMSTGVAQKLVKAGVKYIDVAGFGGSNFIEIENLRNYDKDFSDLYGWGIPTSKAILNARQASGQVFLIASGGIKTALDIVKAIILGADMVAISGEILKYILHAGQEGAKEYLADLIYKVKIVMIMLGAKNIEELKQVPYRLTGKLKEITD